MNRCRTAVIAMLLLIVKAADAAQAEGRSQDEHSEGNPAHVELTDDLAALRRDFTASRTKVRLVFIVGPTCPVCLRGLDDMNRVLGDEIRTNPSIVAFVVHVPTLGANEKHVAAAAKLLEGRDIHHYWDGTGKSGILYQKVLDLIHKSQPDTGIYAWDIWMIYRPGTTWHGPLPPKPDHWEHQLHALDSSNHLDPERFANYVRGYLNELK